MPTIEGIRPRVLVAEDDDSLRRLIELRLGARGFDVRSAPDGVVALELIEEWTPDIVVCDVMMPRLSGLTVCRELRLRAETREVPIVLLTARCFDEDIQQVMALGNMEYMSKPFNFAHLEEWLRVQLGLVDPNAPRVVNLVEGATR
jgi:two-component system, OmpR family, phosphate regulon response regulator PhoB